MTGKRMLSCDVLRFDAGDEIQRISRRLRQVIPGIMRKRGAVVAISGGVDSSVTAALCVEALGPKRVLGLLLPEKESSEESEGLALALADSLGIRTVREEITGVLEAAGCYRRRDEALREVIPQYGDGWRCKIVLPSILERDRLNFYSVVACSPEGNEVRRRLTPSSYLGVVAATNLKQRTRKMMEYCHADRLNYAVAGTPNRLEYDQGFFVKLGDGSADVKPIAHLYKTQVYQLAQALGAPEEICNRLPTTDTYSLPQSQEEFYFALPYEKMDLCLYAKNNGYSAEETAGAVGLIPEQVERVFRDIDSKRHGTAYLHMPAILMGAVPEICEWEASDHRLQASAVGGAEGEK